MLLIASLSLAIIAGAFLLGYQKGSERRSTLANEALERLDRRAAVKAQIAKDADVLINYPAKKARAAEIKTKEVKDKIQNIKEQIQQHKLKVPEAPPLPDDFKLIGPALMELVNAQDEEIKSLKAERDQLYVARDAWKVAYDAEVNRVIAQDLAHQAMMAAEKTNRIKIGCISFGIGVLSGIIGKR